LAIPGKISSESLGGDKGTELRVTAETGRKSVKLRDEGFDGTRTGDWLDLGRFPKGTTTSPERCTRKRSRRSDSTSVHKELISLIKTPARINELPMGPKASEE